MAQRSPLRDVARAISKDFESGRPSEGSLSMGLMLVDQPGICDALLDLLIAEGQKKRPDNHVIGGLLHMLGQILTQARMRAESSGTEPHLVSDFRHQLELAVDAGGLDADLLLGIAQQFGVARLDVGDGLRASLMEMSTDAAASEMPELGAEEITALLAEVARDLGADPFIIHTQIAETFSAFPPDAQGLLINALAVSDVPAMRDAALGWLLDPNVAVARAAAACLQEVAEEGLVSATAARRMTMMRDWVAAEVRDAIDATSRAVRREGAQAKAAQALEKVTVLASGCDGAGAQTYLVFGKRGRTHAMASLLLKQGFGVREAFVHEGLSKREAEQMRDAVKDELDPFEGSLDLVRDALENALAANKAQSSPPPFALLAFLEALGWGAVHAAACPPDALLDRLLADLPPERTSPAALAQALAASAEWPDRLPFTRSWLEDIDRGLPSLAEARTKTRKKAIIMAQVLSPRRTRWGEVLAWTAAAAKDRALTEDWIDLALVAREWLGDRPLSTMPVADWIAGNTVDALRGR